jgi:hypothetical protein
VTDTVHIEGAGLRMDIPLRSAQLMIDAGEVVRRWMVANNVPAGSYTMRLSVRHEGEPNDRAYLEVFEICPTAPREEK